jgi:gliding motility-associated-like protein
VARFILCGDADDRSISLSGGPYGSVSWQILDGAAPNTNDECPNTNPSDYTQVSTAQTFSLDASSVPASTGAEYRVVADGQIFYFEVLKSTITQTFTKKNFVCNNPGRIEITGLPNNYQFRIREGSGGFGPYQSSSIFPDLDPGIYTVQTRLNISGAVCEYLYDPIEIEQVDIEIDVTFTNPVCSGETGSIDVVVNPEVPGPYVYTLLDENGAEIEFTSTISSNTYTFGAVSEGTYAVKVETNDCKEDIPAGIPAPIQYNDTSGNPITVGTGLSPITVDTDTNGMSFGCSTISSVDIDVTPSGGSGTYSYTVSDGGNSGGNFTGTSSYTVTSPGTYTFYITDDQGCTAEKSEYVAELAPPDVTAGDIVGTCTNGGGKVEFTVNDAQGFNLEYRATNTAGDPFTSSSIIPVADGTYNIVEVRYSQGAFNCILSLSPVTVTSAGGLSGSYTLTQDYTCSNGEGIIVFDPASGGSGSGYEYSVDNVNYQAGTTFTGLTPGTTYTPYIRDDAGCYQALAPITVSEPVPPTAINFTQDNLDCATGTSRVTVDVLPGGFPVAQYEIVSSNPATVLPPAQGSNVFNGLRLDTSYQFEITDTDDCVYPASFTTGGISSIRARVRSGGDRRVCPGTTDGNGAFLIDGFATDYDYVITGPTSPSSAPPLPASGTSSSLEIPISGLGAGTYEITVTDNDTNCTSTASFDVVEAATPLGVTPDVTDMSCQNNNIGRVSANATGGFGSYRYRLEWPPASGVSPQGPKTGRTFGGLTEPGTYTLTVIDSEGCTAQTTFTLTEVEAPTIAFGSADYCYSSTNDAEITVTSTAGTGSGAAALATHQYRINGGPLQTPGTEGTYTFNNLVPGDYTIEVVDGNGCTDDLLVTIPPQIQIGLDLITEIPCGGNGEMGITVSGGDISNLASTSYTIYLNGNPVAGHSGVQLPSSSFNYTVPLGSAGDYTVEVTDNNGCTNTSPPLTFSPPASITVLPPRVVGPSCGDANSGLVEIFPDVSAGTPPFQVAFAPGGTGLVDDPFNPDPGNTYNYSSQTVYSGLPAGTYEYVVKDARNCTTGVLTVTVNTDTTNPPNATVSPIAATCSGTVVSGGITIDNITDGAPDFTIIVEDNFGNEFVRRENVTLADLPLAITDPSLVQGNYTVITLDSRGCIDQDAVSINSTDLDIVPNFTAPTVCDRGNLPQCVDIVGGVGPFDIRLVTDPPSTYIDLGPTATNYCFTGLVPGSSYTVQVLDEGTNCEYTETVDVPDGPNPLNVALSIDNGNCYGEDVELVYTITGATGPTFDIVIRNLDTGTVVTNATTSNTSDTFLVPQGPYGISVIDNGTDCTGGDDVEATLDMPRVDVIDNQNANCNELGQLTVRGSGGTPYPASGAGSLPDGSPYEYAFVDGGTTPVSGDYDTETTVFLAGTLIGAPYDIWVRDSRGCEYMTSATVVQLNPALPDPGIVVNNQCNGSIPPSGFEIELTMPAPVDNPTFTLGGQTQTPAYDPMNPTTAIFNVGNNIGVYDVYVVDANGCDVSTTAEVYQILSASGNFSTEPTCNDSDGVITITANGGSGNFSFELRDGSGAPTGNTTGQTTGVFTGIAPGDYEVMVTDDIANDGTIFCPFLVDGITLDPAISPIINDTGESDITCNDSNPDNGSISVSLQSGTDTDGIQEYNLYSSTLAAMPANLDISGRIDTNVSGSFTGLAQGTYVVEVLTDRNCFDRAEVTIDEPPVFEIDAVAGTLTCNPNANQYSTTTVSATIVGSNIGNGGPYGYKIDPADSYQSSPDFRITDTGSDQTVTIYAIDANGCEFNDSVTVLAPNTVTATITRLRPMDCENPERIRVEVTGTTDFIVRGQGFSVSPVGDYVQPSGNEIIFDLPMVAGEYRLEVEDVGGCTYPIAAYVVAEPDLPTIAISQNEPVGCLGDPDGILNIEVTNLASLTNFSGVYDYWVYDAADPGFSGGAFGTPVAGNSTGTIDVVADGNPTTITGLPGGNLRVVIREQEKTVAGCDVFSNTSTIETPSEQLRITSLDEIGRVGCSDDLGEIVAATTGGWDNSPYEYMLEYENPIGSGFAPHSNPSYATFAANGNNNRFIGLSSGNYRVTVRDIEGCIHFEELELFTVPPIQADAIVTRELECPTGADAIIEAVEPGTTTPGAIGGVPGGGYQYRLIKLDPNNPDPTDPTNHISSSGLQNGPEFVGTAGTGVIEGGWYAIEVVSTSNCQAFTVPVEVVPPPPINPALIQTSVPACGNDATMMIRVNNPQGGTYEYRRIYPTGHPLYLPPGDPSIVWEPVDETDANNLPVKTMIPGDIGEAYRYEVRNVVGTSSCLARKTNGITITDAEPLSLDPASPTFDISCAYEVDGRIEAIAEGGTGIYEFRIYDYDPDPANPDGSKDAFLAETLPTYQNRPTQDFGTFENLEEGTYYISVVSRQTCGVVSEPFTIIAPAPVTLESSATPTTCFGETDGTITMNVTSATSGLVKFAIEPNLSEFFSDPDNPMTYTFTDLAANTPSNPSYTVLAQDAEGCPQTFEIVITEPDQLTVTDVVTTPETCIMASDGTAQLTIAGGTPFVDASTSTEYYETRWVGPDSDGSEDFVRNDDLFFDNLAGGVSYIVFIRDANLCDTFVEVPIEIGVDLTAEPIVEYGCEGIFPNSTARIALQDESRISEILFALDPIDPTDAITARAAPERIWGDLPAGDHTVYIYHENGCTNSVEFTIDAYEPLTLDAEKTGPNELTAVATGGFGGYEYFFNGESYGNEGIYTTMESGIVEVRVVDQNGCVAVASIPFEFTGMLELPNFFTPNGDNENDFWSPGNREFFPNIEVIIYDRYGRVVAELDQVSKWDGLYKGKELPTGDYWYVVNQNDKRETRYVGHFTLYR